MVTQLQRVLTLKQLRMVSVLGRELHLSRSAEVLHTTQPAISRALAQLEEQLGMRLFVRTTKRIVPTVASLCLIQHANRVLTEIDLAQEELQGLGGGIMAEMRIGVLASFSPHVLAEAMASARSLLPAVLLISQQQPIETLYEQLLDGRIDMMLAHAELRVDLNVVQVIPLYDEFSTVLAGAQHGLRRRKAPSWNDLAQEAWVLPPPQTPLRPKIDRMLSLYRKLDCAPQEPDIQTDSSMLALQLIQQTSMLWAIANQQAQRFLKTAEVRVIPAPTALIRGPMCCFHLRRDSAKSEVRLFIGCLQDSVRAQVLSIGNSI